MMTRSRKISRRDFLKLAVTALGGASLACGKGQRLTEQASTPNPSPTQPMNPPTSRPKENEASGSPTPQSLDLPTPAPTPAGPRGRIITHNDFVSEQPNYIETLVVLVNYSSRRDQVFDLKQYWDRIFGMDKPIEQLNAYYNENFYGQLLLKPVEVGAKGYIEVELAGAPQDYSFGFLVGMGTDEIAQLDPDEALKLILEVMAKVVTKHPEINYQDKFMLIVLNARGVEYGRGAAGALPTGGVEPIYDMFIGNLKEEDRDKFANPEYFRMAGEDKIVGVVRKNGYVFDDYFRDREEAALDDQFILGIGLFGKDAPLSCAVHDNLHGLRRKSAYAYPPEGRGRAANCLYNLLEQSKWVIGSEAHGHFDRSINVSPYIGWWDPMGDHLHPVGREDFYCSHPHGMSAFTKLRMGMIPDRCQTVVEQDDLTLNLAPLSQSRLPPPGSGAELLAVKIPIIPKKPEAAFAYLLLEYRARIGEGGHPDSFHITPDFIVGDQQWDPGCDLPAAPDECSINPPMTFVSKEGVLVYLVNEKMTEIATLEYKPEEWYKFILVLLNPAGNEKRDDLTQVALSAGESLAIDFRNLYTGVNVPVQITVSVNSLTKDYATIHITREYLK